LFDENINYFILKNAYFAQKDAKPIKIEKIFLKIIRLRG
jgi:hypothetical protein